MGNYPVLVDLWNYVHTVLWNWAGILLAIDGFVALGERYFGEWLETKHGTRLKVPTRLKISFAVIVLIIAQAIAYRGPQGQLQSEIATNGPLHAEIYGLTRENADLRAGGISGESATTKATIEQQGRNITDLTRQLTTAKDKGAALQRQLQGLSNPKYWVSIGRAVNSRWAENSTAPGKTIEDTNATEVVAFCNYAIKAPWQVEVQFDRLILNGIAEVDGVGGSQSGGTMIADSRIPKTMFGAQVISPPVGPYAPVFVTVQTKGYAHARAVSLRAQ